MGGEGPRPPPPRLMFDDLSCGAGAQSSKSEPKNSQNVASAQMDITSSSWLSVEGFGTLWRESLRKHTHLEPGRCGHIGKCNATTGRDCRKTVNKDLRSFADDIPSSEVVAKL